MTAKKYIYNFSVHALNSVISYSVFLKQDSIYMYVSNILEHKMHNKCIFENKLNFPNLIIIIFVLISKKKYLWYFRSFYF